jgi:hypothetical protein
MVTESAAYAEHVIGGYTYTEPETVTRLAHLFDTIRAESYRASESAAIFRRQPRYGLANKQLLKRQRRPVRRSRVARDAAGRTRRWRGSYPGGGVTDVPDASGVVPAQVGDQHGG